MDIVYRCGKCGEPMRIPLKYMYVDIDDPWFIANTQVNSDHACLNCQIKMGNTFEAYEKASMYDGLNK